MELMWGVKVECDNRPVRTGEHSGEHEVNGVRGLRGVQTWQRLTNIYSKRSSYDFGHVDVETTGESQ